jgi:hypothetical protein
MPEMGFVILAPEHNVARIKSTVKSIKANCGQPCLCVVGDTTSKKEIQEIKEICPCIKGKSTITSLINTGLSKGHPNWNIIVMEGVWIKPTVEKKYYRFQKDIKNIVYPVMIEFDRLGKVQKTYSHFYDCSLNGVMIHKKLFDEVGEFTDTETLENARILWASAALEKQAKLNGIAGIRIC